MIENNCIVDVSIGYVEVSYLEDDMIVSLIICTLVMDLWTSVIPFIFFELVEMYCPDCVM